MAAPSEKPPPAAPAALNVYQKVSVIRRSDDTLNYEDAEGNVKSVSIQELGDAIASATPLVAPKKKLDIPVPRINTVATYTRDVAADYELPRSYVRHHRVTQEDLQEILEYVADEEDETWLKNNARFGGKVDEDADEHKSDTVLKRRPHLPLEILEQMMDVLEKATGFEAIVTLHQAEQSLLTKIPQLIHMFPAKSRDSVTTKQVVHDVYNYWVQKRSKLKRPLLRRFWPVTSTDDTNPHLVFRPREKEKYKLRRKRQNDMDGYMKLKQLRNDFDTLRTVLDLVRRREELNRMHLQIQIDLFQQRLHDCIDTSGMPRLSSHSRDESKRILEVPIYFDPHTGGRRKRLRPAGSGRSTPLPLAVPQAANRDKSGSTKDSGGVAAGRNHGEPAPLFLHPLYTRESYTTSWEGVGPYVPTYVDARAQPTFLFRQRPRIGRGGRVIIDRVPQPIPTNDEGKSMNPVSVMIAGRALPQSTENKDSLLDLLPEPLDHRSLSRKIELLSVAAVKEDSDARNMSLSTSAGETDENDGDEVVVKVDDWLDTDDQWWGEERFALGPV